MHAGLASGCMSTTTFQLAVGSPIVTRTGTTWADEGSIEDLARIAETADRLGYHHLTCTSTLHCRHRNSTAEVPSTGIRSPRSGISLPVPSASVSRPSVLVLPYHHPLEIAKQYGTLDKVSNGRVILGVGVGTLKEEFDLLGAPFDDRGPRADDALKALRASLVQTLTRVSRSVLRLRGTRRRSMRRPGPSADLGRRADAAFASSGCGTHRWLVPLRRGSDAGCRVARAGGRPPGFRGGASTDRAPQSGERTRKNGGRPRTDGCIGSDDHHDRFRQRIAAGLPRKPRSARLHSGGDVTVPGIEAELFAIPPPSDAPDCRL